MGENKLLGSLCVDGVADNYFICHANYNELTAQKALTLKELNKQEKDMFANWNTDSNPILILFRLE